MATDIVYPKVSLETNSGTISRWHVKNGDTVKQGQLLFEIDNDKTVVEIDAPHDGIIRILKPSTTDEVDVGQSVASLHAAGEAPVETSADRSAPVTQTSTPAVIAEVPATPVTEPSLAGRSDRTIATPLAKRLAGSAGIDLSALTGSGPGGRIQKKDIVTAMQSGLSAQIAKPATARTTASHTATGTLLNAVWLRKGESTPIVLLHGFASDHNNWRGLFAGSALQHPMLAIDLPSHGNSPLVGVDSIDTIAAMVAETLAAQHIQTAVLVGHSFGAAVATRLTALGLIDVSALGLFAPAGLGPAMNRGFVENFVRAKSKASVTPWLHELVHDKAVISETFINAVVDQRINQALSDAMAAFAEQFFTDGTQTVSIGEDLAQLDIPVRVVFGKQDRILPFQYTRNLPDNVALHAFDACGHMPHLEKRGLSLRILSELVASAGR